MPESHNQRPGIWATPGYQNAQVSYSFDWPVVDKSLQHDPCQSADMRRSHYPVPPAVDQMSSQPHWSMEPTKQQTQSPGELPDRHNHQCLTPCPGIWATPGYQNAQVFQDSARPSAVLPSCRASCLLDHMRTSYPTSQAVLNFPGPYPGIRATPGHHNALKKHGGDQGRTHTGTVPDAGNDSGGLIPMSKAPVVDAISPNSGMWATPGNQNAHVHQAPDFSIPHTPCHQTRQPFQNEPFDPYVQLAQGLSHRGTRRDQSSLPTRPGQPHHAQCTQGTNPKVSHPGPSPKKGATLGNDNAHWVPMAPFAQAVDESDVQSLMAAGVQLRQSRIGETPTQPIMDNPAMVAQPDMLDDEEDNDSSDDASSTSEDNPAWRRFYVYTVHQPPSQVSLNMVSQRLQQHQCARALGWTMEQLKAKYQVSPCPADLYQSGFRGMLARFHEDPPEEGQLAMALIDVEFHPPAPSWDPEIIRTAMFVPREVTNHQFLESMHLLPYCRYNRRPCLLLLREQRINLDWEVSMQVMDGSYIRVVLPPPNEEDEATSTRRIAMACYQGIGQEFFEFFGDLVEEYNLWSMPNPSQVLVVDSPDDEPESAQEGVALLQLTSARTSYTSKECEGATTLFLHGTRHHLVLVSNTSDQPCTSQGLVQVKEPANSQRSGRKYPEEKKSGMTIKQPASRAPEPDKQPATGTPEPWRSQPRMTIRSPVASKGAMHVEVASHHAGKLPHLSLQKSVGHPSLVATALALRGASSKFWKMSPLGAIMTADASVLLPRCPNTYIYGSATHPPCVRRHSRWVTRTEVVGHSCACIELGRRPNLDHLQSPKAGPLRPSIPPAWLAKPSNSVICQEEFMPSQKLTSPKGDRYAFEKSCSIPNHNLSCFRATGPR